MLRRLAAGPREAELREIHHSLLTTSRRLEISMSLKKVGAGQLTPSTRALRGWISFLSDWEDLAGYARAVERARPLLDAAAKQTRRWKGPVWLHLRPMRGMYQARQKRDGVELSLPTGAVCFSADAFGAVARTVFLDDLAAKRQVLGFMQSEEFAAISAELVVLSGAVDEAKGETYDLNEIFDRVNAAYFDGRVKRPKLFWSRSLTRRKFGHYDWVGDAVMISRTLDSAKAPEFVVDFIMYHELLHKVHGLRWSGGKQYAHTAAFYRDEKKFKQYDQAEARLKLLARSK
jgi:hypothetical protein